MAAGVARVAQTAQIVQFNPEMGRSIWGIRAERSVPASEPPDCRYPGLVSAPECHFRREDRASAQVAGSNSSPRVLELNCTAKPTSGLDEKKPMAAELMQCQASASPGLRDSSPSERRNHIVLNWRCGQHSGEKANREFSPHHGEAEGKGKHEGEPTTHTRDLSQPQDCDGAGSKQKNCGSEEITGAPRNL